MARRFLAAVVLVLLGAVPSLAGEPTDRLRTFFERANRIILAPELEGGVEERVMAVRTLVNGIFDFDGASAQALGRHWERTPSSSIASVRRPGRSPARRRPRARFARWWPRRRPSDLRRGSSRRRRPRIRRALPR